MKSPIRTTLVYGLICALIAMPATVGLAGIVGGSIAFKLVLWTILSGYSLLLARWSGKHPAVLLFPLILLLGTAVWPGIDSIFFFLGLGVLCWLRSGICFSHFPLRATIAETVTAAAVLRWSPCWDRAAPSPGPSVYGCSSWCRRSTFSSSRIAVRQPPTGKTSIPLTRPGAKHSGSWKAPIEKKACPENHPPHERRTSNVQHRISNKK